MKPQVLIQFVGVLIAATASFSADVKVLSAKNDPDIQIGYQMLAPELGVKPYTICGNNKTYWVVAKRSYSICEDAMRLYPSSLGAPTKANLKKSHSACLGINDLPNPIKPEFGSVFVIKQQLMPCSPRDSMSLTARFPRRYVKREIEENIEYCLVKDSVIVADSATQATRARIRNFQETVAKTVPSATGTKPFLSEESVVLVLGGCLTEKELAKLMPLIDDNFSVYQIRDHR